MGFNSALKGLKWNFWYIGYEDVECINVALDGNQCRNLVEKATNVTGLVKLYITELFTVLWISILTVKKEAEQSNETLPSTYKTARFQNSEDHSINNHRHTSLTTRVDNYFTDHFIYTMNDFIYNTGPLYHSNNVVHPNYMLIWQIHFPPYGEHSPCPS